MRCSAETWLSALQEGPAQVSFSVYVQDCLRGSPAGGVSVGLEKRNAGRWEVFGQSATDDDGLLRDPGPPPDREGVYRLTFDIDGYFVTLGTESVYPVIIVVFRVSDPDKPLYFSVFVTPNSYSCYTGVERCPYTGGATRSP
jgi:5-hydroxyisourate hydrolase